MNGRRSLLGLVATGLVLSVVPAAWADTGPNTTPTQEACLKKVLTAAEYEQFLLTPYDVALKDKSKSCLTSGGSTGSGSSSAGTASKPLKSIPTTGKWILANPVDLAHVTSISVFRSCSGHDSSGNNVNGKPESDRSMKHYVQTDVPWTSTDSIRGVAPFAGTVTITDEQFPLGKQLSVTSAVTGWQMVFFHGDPQVKNGAKVKAGQVVTAWPPSNAPAVIDQLHPEGTSFDIAFRSYDGRYLDSPLLHMVPKVSRVWNAKGFTASRAIVSQAARDTAPCKGTYNATDASDWIKAN
ncbi:MAG: hypothetical protein NTX29_04000 [Actinobacteria bacterium]|nr:hypothetical protein [Actinomycetota bacterium]